MQMTIIYNYAAEFSVWPHSSLEKVITATSYDTLVDNSLSTDNIA